MECGLDRKLIVLFSRVVVRIGVSLGSIPSKHAQWTAGAMVSVNYRIFLPLTLIGVPDMEFLQCRTPS